MASRPRLLPCAARARPSLTARVARRVIAGLLVAGSAAGIAADPAEFRCAALLPSADKSPAYRRIAGEARCEGYFEQNVSQPFVELLSLTRHRPDTALPAPPGGVIEVAPRAAGAVRLRVQPTRPTPFYRVDADLAAGQVLRWNSTAMLAHTGLRLGELGFVAQRASGVATAPAPAVVPVSLPPLADDPARVWATLRVSVPVASVAARRYRLASGAAGALVGDWKALPGTPLDAWDVIALPIESPADGLDVNVDIRAVGRDGQLLPLLQFVVGR